MKEQKKTETYREPRMELVMLPEAEVFTLNVGGGGSVEAPVGPQGDGTNRITEGGWF